MQRKTRFGIGFGIAFAAAYLILCFCIPGLRIKLEATPMVYFAASIRHMAFLKLAVSLAVGLLAGTLAGMLKK